MSENSGSLGPRQMTDRKIEFRVCVGLQGPIVPGDYEVGDTTINVSYPEEVDLGHPTPIKLPQGVSTLFAVTWVDDKGETDKQLRSKSFEVHFPIYKILDHINQLIIAFKLMRIGHRDVLKLRTIGFADTLFFRSFIDDVPVGPKSLGLKLDPRSYPWVAEGHHPFDSSGTTKLALPHIDAESFPVARRYVRCFELLEHGYYSEAIIVAHAILDDLVQKTISEQLSKKGLKDAKSQRKLVRAIKESRFQIYLGPLLKVLAGNDLSEIWPESGKAIDWFNEVRNQIAHQGSTVERDGACKAIFVSMKVAAALSSKNLIEAEFPPGMCRQALIQAAWTPAPNSWTPSDEEAERDRFY